MGQYSGYLGKDFRELVNKGEKKQGTALKPLDEKQGYRFHEI